MSGFSRSSFLPLLLDSLNFPADAMPRCGTTRNENPVVASVTDG
jgi:hypothetical protein